MELIPIFGIGIFGLAVGSFTNAAVYRLKICEIKSIFFGRSFCPRCKKTLRARDLIPLASFLLLRGRCRFCRKKISPHYFWVELATAVAFGGVAVFTGFADLALLSWNLFFTAIFIFLASFDFLFGEIPDEVSLPASLLAFLGSFLAFTIAPCESLIGLLAGGGFFAAIVLISNGKWMGGGDIRFGLLLGALLGWQGFAIAVFAASFLGSTVGVIQILQKKKKLKSALPFAPFLAAGGVAAILFAEEIWEWYLSFF
ncbi:prepilin peptidase [Patescibacteria group bacterium]|nr:prepilin peptidase [Patescibacteria group bacterium]